MGRHADGDKDLEINIAFKTSCGFTPRVCAVSDAFGLGLDEDREYVVFKDFRVSIRDRDVVYIVGPSGSGKSCLLREFERAFGDRCLTLEDVGFIRDRPLVDTLGEDVNEAIRYLSLFGLNDAFLFLRRYDELSTGQKYRYRLAKLWEQSEKTGKPYLFVDEFASTLDRETAKIIAFNLQKLARKTGKTVFLATCHDDLRGDLNPSVYVSKDLWSEVVTEYSENTVNAECSINRSIRVEKGTWKDYLALRHFHYRGRRPVVRRVFKAAFRGRVVGVILYCYAPLTNFGRRHAFKKDFYAGFPMERINRHLCIISRVVVHPRYRSIGLGARLVRETLPLVDLPFVEAIAVMARYNPFFEKAGMKKICEKKPDQGLVELLESLRNTGLNTELAGSQNYVYTWLDTLGSQRISEVKAELKGLRHPYVYKNWHIYQVRGAGNRRRLWAGKLDDMGLEGLARVISLIHQLCQRKIYLLWANLDPKFRDAREKYLREEYHSIWNK